MNPTISVLFTSYNHRAHLEEALESVRQQTYPFAEILALDDGSTDGSREWLAAQSGVTCLFHAQNMGTYASLNVGLNRAVGDWVAVLNDDDVWMPEKLAKQVEVLSQNPEIRLVSTYGHFIGPAGETLEGEPLGFAFPRMDDGPNRSFLPLVVRNRIIASSALFHRETALGLGGFDPTYFGCGDWDFWLKIARAHEVGFVDEDLTLYRVHPTNASRHQEKMEADTRCIRERIDAESELHPLRGRPEFQAAFGLNAAALARNYAQIGERKKARAMFVKSLRYAPGRWQTYLRWLASEFGIYGG